LGDKVPADKTKVEGLVKDLREALRTTMSGSRHSCLNCSSSVCRGSNLYQQGGGDTAAGPSPDGSSNPHLPAAAMM